MLRVRSLALVLLALLLAPTLGRLGLLDASVWCRKARAAAPDSAAAAEEIFARLAGDWAIVTVPARGFVSVDQARPWPAVEGRMRALVFAIGAPHAGARADLAGEVTLDDIELVRFDEARREETFLTSGATMPSDFAPVAEGENPPPEPSKFVNPSIFGDEFDPATVHSGTGSFRIRLVESGLAEVALSLTPGRDYTKARPSPSGRGAPRAGSVCAWGSRTR